MGNIETETDDASKAYVLVQADTVIQLMGPLHHAV
jgi:hypothetical protein